ncbi:MAG: META domain-containing protein, partial [Spirochaetaceae bacterium]|nr:META domain-containing protein [Spirochaetaceae bacterium]
MRILKTAMLAAPAILIFALTSCTTPEAEPPVEPAPVPAPEPIAPPVAEPDPLGIEWADTAWILPDPPDKRPKEYPGYRGFHLAQDGRLRLINLDSAVGAEWSAEGNRITLIMEEGRPNLPLEDTFLVYPGPGEGGEKSSESTTSTGKSEVRSIRLVPEARPDSQGIILERAGINVDIVENHWIPRELDGGGSVMWPMNREVHLMLLPDAVGGMGVLGYGGENRFRGTVELDHVTFVVGPMAATRRIGPASEFENLYMRRIAEADSFVQVGDDLFLYAESRPLAAFRVRL